MGVRPSISILSVLRDVASFLGGWALIFKQAGILFDPPAHPSEVLILLAAVAIGIPGAAQLLAARAGQGAPTAPPSSPPPAAESSPSSSGA